MSKPTLLDLARQFAQKQLDLVADALKKNDQSTLQTDLESSVTKFLEDTVALEAAPEAVTPSSALLFKSDDDKRLVWGWGSVVTEKGVPVIDSQGDVIEVEEMTKAVHEFMHSSRSCDHMHELPGIGRVVESVMFTNELQKLLKIDLGREGWFVCVKVDNDDVWKDVKSGKLRAFSFGGSAIREPMND